MKSKILNFYKRNRFFDLLVFYKHFESFYSETQNVKGIYENTDILLNILNDERPIKMKVYILDWEKIFAMHLVNNRFDLEYIKIFYKIK